MTLAEYTSKLTIHFNDKRVVEKPWFEISSLCTKSIDSPVTSQ